MKISLLQEKLIKPLSFVGKNISPKSQLPITQHIYLFAKEGQLTLATTNLETTIYTKVAVKVEKEGGICVPFKLFSEYIQSLPQDKITLTVEKQNLIVQCNGYEAAIPGVAKEEFPQITKKIKESITLEGDAFFEAIRLVAFSSATDESRPLLTGVKIKNTKDGCLFVATDGYRLSLKRTQIALPEKFDTVLPGRALLEVVHVWQEEKEKKNATMHVMEDGQLGFIVGETEIYTRSIEGEYPNFERIIPKSTTTTVTLKKEPFLRGMKSAAIFARDSANIVKIHIEDGVLIATANTPQIGENKVEIAVEKEGEDGDVAFNSRFLLEFLNNSTDEDLVFEMTGSLNPGAFKTPKDDSYLHIIMPVRVQA